MSIPISFSVDIVGKAVLKDEAELEMLKVVEEKDNLFTSSPIGTTMQDGGKRKRSGGAGYEQYKTSVICPFFF